MKKIFILTVILFGLLLTNCDSPTESTTHTVTYSFDNVNIGYSYLDPTSNSIVHKNYPYPSTFTKTFNNVSGSINLEAGGVCELSAYGVTVKIIIDGKEVAKGHDHQATSVQYFLK